MGAFGSTIGGGAFGSAPPTGGSLFAPSVPQEQVLMIVKHAAVHMIETQAAGAYNREAGSRCI